MSEPGSGEPTDLECRRIAELLGDYLEGSLPRSTRELLEWHLEGCPPCIAFVNTYRGAVGATKALKDVPVPPELKRRLLAVLRAREASTRKSSE
jgi:hypothetical protein